MSPSFGIPVRRHLSHYGKLCVHSFVVIGQSFLLKDSNDNSLQKRLMETRLLARGETGVLQAQGSDQWQACISHLESQILNVKEWDFP